MHSSLRSLNFWRIILINLLVSAFVYMVMPLWPLKLEQNEGVALQTSGWMMMFFCVGLFVPGAFSSYLLDKYRRKAVCFWSIVVLVLVSILSTLEMDIWLVALLRFLQGVSFSLFHIALGSTILIDITVSERRDVASFIYFWASRIALALGPAFGVLALRDELWVYLKYFPPLCALISVYLVARIDLPFRTPLENKFISLDRFLLLRTWPLAILLFPVTFALGVEMALNLHPLFYLSLLIGILLSFGAHFIVFYRSDIRAEIFTGYLALIIGFILLLAQDDEVMVRVASGITGFGVGAVTGRIQSFMTAISKHTERGSAQGSYKLSFESGLCCGFFFTTIIGVSQAQNLYLCTICCLALILAFYLLVVHRWFMANVKRR